MTNPETRAIDAARLCALVSRYQASQASCAEESELFSVLLPRLAEVCIRLMRPSIAPDMDLPTVRDELISDMSGKLRHCRTEDHRQAFNFFIRVGIRSIQMSLRSRSRYVARFPVYLSDVPLAD